MPKGRLGAVPHIEPFLFRLAELHALRANDKLIGLMMGYSQYVIRKYRHRLELPAWPAETKALFL